MADDERGGSRGVTGSRDHAYRRVDDNLVMIGTEKGVYVSTNAFDASPTWEAANTNMGNIPVFMLKQQIVKKQDVVLSYVVGNDTSYRTYKGTNNYGVIYAATFGRGLYKTDQFQQPVGIDNPENELISDVEFVIYPNPVSDFTNVKFNLKNSVNVSVNVFDLNGRLVKSTKLQNATIGSNNIKVDCNALSKGAYLMQLIVGQSTSTSKFIVL